MQVYVYLCKTEALRIRHLVRGFYLDENTRISDRQQMVLIIRCVSLNLIHWTLALIPSKEI